MKDGLYVAQFKTPFAHGSGVVLVNGRSIAGGDSITYYIGTLQEVSGRVTGNLRASVHSRSTTIQPIFGVDTVHISFSGDCTEDSAEVTGNAREAPNVLFKASLRFLCDR